MKLFLGGFFEVKGFDSRHAQSGKQRNFNSFHGKASKSAFLRGKFHDAKRSFRLFLPNIGLGRKKCGGGRSNWGICQNTPFLLCLLVARETLLVYYFREDKGTRV